MVVNSLYFLLLLKLIFVLNTRATDMPEEHMFRIHIHRIENDIPNTQRRIQIQAPHTLRYFQSLSAENVDQGTYVPTDIPTLTPTLIQPTKEPINYPSIESTSNPTKQVIAHGDGCFENGIQYTCLPGDYCTNTFPYCYACPANEYCPTGLYSYYCPTGLASTPRSKSCSLPGNDSV